MELSEMGMISSSGLFHWEISYWVHFVRSSLDIVWAHRASYCGLSSSCLCVFAHCVLTSLLLCTSFTSSNALTESMSRIVSLLSQLINFE